jgi:hypothetical protein
LKQKIADGVQLPGRKIIWMLVFDAFYFPKSHGGQLGRREGRGVVEEVERN